MAYTSGLLKHRVTILNRKGGTAEDYAEFKQYNEFAESI
jgi:hypothetical protein